MDGDVARGGEFFFWGERGGGGGGLSRPELKKGATLKNINGFWVDLLSIVFFGVDCARFWENMN